MALREVTSTETIKHEQGEQLLSWIKAGIDQLAKARGRTERLNQRDKEVVLNNPPQILQDLIKYFELPPDQKSLSFSEVKHLLETSLPEGREMAERAAFIAAVSGILKAQGYKCQLPPRDLMGRHDIALAIDLTSDDGKLPMGSRELLIRIAHGLPVESIPHDAKIIFTYPEEPFEKLILPENISSPTGEATGIGGLMRQRPRSEGAVFKGETAVVEKWRRIVNASWEGLYRATDDEAERLKCDPEEIDAALLCIPDLRTNSFLLDPDTGESVTFYDQRVGRERNYLDERLAQGMVMNNYHPTTTGSETAKAA